MDRADEAEAGRRVKIIPAVSFYLIGKCNEMDTCTFYSLTVIVSYLKQYVRSHLVLIILSGHMCELSSPFL